MVADAGLLNGESDIIQKDRQNKIVISYLDSRAKKDDHNRQRGIQKLEKLIRTKKTDQNTDQQQRLQYVLRMTGATLPSPSAPFLKTKGGKTA